MMNRPFTIRSAREDDLVAIVRLLAEDELRRSREEVAAPLPSFYAAAFREIDRDPRHELIVVEEVGKVVGTAQLSFIPSLSHRGGERAQIEGVRVAASHRRVGIGRSLFAWMIDRAERRGCRMVQLTTDKRRPEARRSYERLGFAATHEGMKLALPRPAHCG